MKSPFPGMDPYIERRWESLHGRLVVYAADSINERLGDAPLRAEPQYRLRVDVHEEDEDGGSYPALPDVVTIETALGDAPYLGDGGGTATLTEPEVIRASELRRKERYVNVVDLEENRVVTTIEFLSPSNKVAGLTRQRFLRKRRDMAEAGVNVVEVDLVRAGRRTLPDDLRGRRRYREAAYLAWARRVHPRPQFEVYPMSFREPLATIRLPLRRGDADLPLALQSLIDLTHEKGRFRPSDYAGPLVPPLPPADADWAAGLLAAAGLAGASTTTEARR